MAGTEAAQGDTDVDLTVDERLLLRDALGHMYTRPDGSITVNPAPHNTAGFGTQRDGRRNVRKALAAWLVGRSMLELSTDGGYKVTDLGHAALNAGLSRRQVGR